MLERLARWCFRRRWIVIALWVIGIVALNVLGASLGDSETADFQLPDTESSQVLDLLERVSPADSGEEGTMVFAAPAGVTDPAVQAEIRSVLDQAAAIEHVVVISPFDGPGQISPDGTVAFARLQIEERQQGPNMIPAAASLLDLREEHQSQLVDIELGGQIFVDFAPPSSETIGLAGAILVLLLAFGSVLAVGLPIGIALFGVGTGVALIGVAGSVINLPDFATTLAVMIGLGVGIDYALFIVTRYREHIAAGEEPEEATVAAIDSAGRAVVFAGTIVIISMLGMLLMGVSFIRGLGIGAALAVFATMVASLTLLPALLGFVQRRIDVTTWYAFLGLIVFDIGLLGFAFGIELLLPLGILAAVVLAIVGRFVPALRKQAPIKQPRDDDQNIWHRWSRTIQRHPWMGLAGGLVVLLLLALPVLGMRAGSTDAGNLPADQTARRAYDLLSASFGPGFNGPFLLAAELPAGTDEAAVAAATQALGNTPGVQFVAPPSVIPGANVALWRLVPATGPQDQATGDLIDRLRDDVIPSTGLPILVGGQTAIFKDFADFLSARLPIFMGTVLVLSFILLMAVFRSILVPLKAVILNLLSIAAAYGIVVAVFQWGWFGGLFGVGKGGPIEAFLPMMLFAIVFGLSMDYEVFLLAYERGVRPVQGQQRRGRQWRLGHRSGHHLGRLDHVPRVRVLRARGHPGDQAVRPRAGDGGVDRRDGGPHGARPGDDGAARGEELVVAEVVGPSPAVDRCRGSSRGASPDRPAFGRPLRGRSRVRLRPGQRGRALTQPLFVS
ncbi:MAG: MMPL family transporter [Ilumatobacteraceae bacterium]